MSKKQALRDLVAQRLECAAEEIFALIEKAFAEYEQEIVRLKWAKLQQERNQTQDVQTPFVRSEVTPEHAVEEQTLCTSLDFTFSSVPLKSEDDVDKSALLQQEPPEENGHSQAATGQLYGANLQPSNNEKPYSCSDPDNSGDWGNSAQKTAQNNDQECDTVHTADSQKQTSNGRSKTQRKRQQRLIDGGVTIKKEREDLDTFNQSGPFSGTVETPFSCSVLIDDFTLPAQTHSSCRPVNCPECGVQLHRQHSLERHISAVHRREKPFRCTVCEKGFAQKTDCAIHMRVHTGERPYSCPVCEKTFNVKNSLRRHLRLHQTHAGVQRNEQERM